MNSTKFMWLLANTRPFPIGPDANNRSVYSCNFRGRAVGSVARMEEAIIELLHEETPTPLATAYNPGTGLGDAWIGPRVVLPTGEGPRVVLPTGEGPYLLVTDTTGGFEPVEMHSGEKDERLAVQILVFAREPDVALDRALAVWRALDGKRNVTVAA